MANHARKIGTKYPKRLKSAVNSHPVAQGGTDDFRGELIVF